LRYTVILTKISNQPALGPKNMASLEGSGRFCEIDFLCKEMFNRDLEIWPIFREGRFSEGLVNREVSLYSRPGA
jgi:hypothetical protein